MNWHIGQEIVCIKTHSEGVVKRGQTYTIRGLRKAFCKCNNTEIDVGIRDMRRLYCTICNQYGDITDIWFFDESRFAPLEYNQDAINELLEQPIYVEK